MCPRASVTELSPTVQSAAAWSARGSRSAGRTDGRPAPIWLIGAVCAVVAQPFDTSSARATESAVPSPAAAAVAAAPSPPDAKAQAHQLEIDTARARCTALLKTITAVAIAKDPIEEGECGTLAPVELVSIGKNPEVVLSPPAIITCDMAVAVHDWIARDVQPLARRHLGKPVLRIETMSSYSCRTAYGRKNHKLSEHGHANALDIRGFVTTGGQTVYVLEDWGLTSSEIAAAATAAQKEQAVREAQLAAAKAEADARARALASAKAQAGPGSGSSSSPLANAKTLVEGLPKVPGASLGSSSMGLTPSDHLGGPKPKPKPAATDRSDPPAAIASDAQPASAKSTFLRAVHDSACLRFGTTLGPEANAEHRNHLHIDLAERKVKKICDN